MILVQLPKYQSSPMKSIPEKIFKICDQASQHAFVQKCVWLTHLNSNRRENFLEIITDVNTAVTQSVTGPKMFHTFYGISSIHGGQMSRPNLHGCTCSVSQKCLHFCLLQAIDNNEVVLYQKILKYKVSLMNPTQKRLQ